MIYFSGKALSELRKEVYWDAFSNSNSSFLITIHITKKFFYTLAFIAVLLQSVWYLLTGINWIIYISSNIVIAVFVLVYDNYLIRRILLIYNEYKRLVEYSEKAVKFTLNYLISSIFFVLIKLFTRSW